MQRDFADGHVEIDTTGLGHVLSISRGLSSIEAGIHEQLRGRLIPGSGRLVAFEAAEQLAQYVVDKWGDAEARVYFAPSGTDAMELALQIALHVQSRRASPIVRQNILGAVDSYHGMSLGMTSVGGHRSHRARLRNHIQGWPKWPSLSESSTWFESQSLDLLESAAALVLEPVGGTTNGATVPVAGTIDRLYLEASKRGCLVIIDEVVTGFGRTGQSFVSSMANADIAVGGKWLGSGYVGLTAVIVSGRILNELESYGRLDLPLRFTFANLSMACATALAVQNHIDDLNLVDAVDERSQQLRTRIEEAVQVAGSSAVLRGVGLLLALEREVENADDAIDHLQRAARKMGVISMFGSRTGRLLSDAPVVHMMCTPPLDITDDDADQLSAAMVKVMSA